MKSVVVKEIIKFGDNKYQKVQDRLVVEEALDVYINSSSKPSFVTMRTPGEDINLALGLLFSNEIITSIEDIVAIKSLSGNALHLLINGPEKLPHSSNFINSSCSLCSHQSWEEIASHSLFPVYDKLMRVQEDVILSATELLYVEDDDFTLTGGNHKVALLAQTGQIIVAFEDVGRHNAFDKVIGYSIKANSLPLSKTLAVLSGRCSYEMCLKAWQGGIPLVISKGAPTSKAVELAESAGITLIGFALNRRFNIYSHPYRILS